jgi:hypothetical protein
MNREKLFSLLRELDFAPGKWAVFGGACLAARGIRPAPDLELFVTEKLYESLRQSEWEEKVAGSTGAAYVETVIDDIPILAFVSCGSDTWRPNAAAYLQNPEIIGGFPFMPLAEMYAWKAATARPKDLADLELIDAYRAHGIS